ncbi:AraC family transcriptional regulator [Achromobacter xylosoxidans]|uniref:HTH-type transcriptional regulator NimR n=1 Tax=Achromobacter ruhlandii TaxID=72557 RepID=A0A2M9GSD5_9BURK|nr:helix-turn-helix transcriptional regulator [Achromobacter ruhlandii]OCZ67844.1 AraC family transcriptional regulator [Achromobacter xylosoxidans]OCZ86883.1 AraC family transcriptional regulator [Achromobacter xylosoxidans]PJM67479.1 AraC family transcriptional regulator [Achromobacter ruhlandii]CAB3852514.1 HTH-type transcriptional regulator NimR [Achromobacter ruhlandii]
MTRLADPASPLIAPALAAARGGPRLLAVRRRDKAVRHTAPHRHARGQLFGAYEGLLTVLAGDRQWVAPATHAVWIPPDCPHGLRSHGPYAGYSVYLSAAACAGLPDAPCALQASALLLAAVERAASWRGDAWDAARLRIVELVRDEIRTLPRAGDGLTLPRDARLRRLALAWSDAPADTRPLAAWAVAIGMAPRTLARRFLAETGLTLGAWRQRARLMRAQQMLAAGHGVTTAALETGYDNISAFIAAFKREYGVTPGRYDGRGPLIA